MVQDAKPVALTRNRNDRAIDWYARFREFLAPLTKQQACFDAYNAGYKAGLNYKNK